MDYVSGSRVTSLSNQVLSWLTLKHAALNAVIADDPANIAEASGLISQIWQLADEFNCAVYVEESLIRIRDSAREMPVGRRL